MMNQKRKKRGFFLNRRTKKPKKPSQKPSNSLQKQRSSCFPMHSHPVIFSIMCKCSYAVKKEHPNKRVESSIQQQQQQKQRQPIVEASPSKVSMIKRGKIKKKVTIGSNQTSNVFDASGVGVGDEAEWPPSTDEDYIVFCFEEDGEFRVVVEDNSKSQDCVDHDYNEESPLPHNLKVEEERFYFSPRLQSDGIRSSTRFKQEVGYEETSRGRVDEEKECKEMEEIKSRGEFDDDQQENIDFLENLELCDTSTECVDGSSAESLVFSRSDKETRLSSSSQAQDGQMLNKETNHVDDEESVYLSSESQQEESQDSDEQSGRGSAETSNSSRSEIIEEEQFEDHQVLNGTINISRSDIIEEEQFEDHEEADETSNISRSEITEEEQYEDHEESAEIYDVSRSEIIEEDQSDDHEESARNSAVSSQSCEDSDRISSSSFEFPALAWECIGSPDIWPKSETPTSIYFRKQKSRRVCLRLCR